MRQLQIFQDLIYQKDETRQKIKKHNSRVLGRGSLNNPLKFVDLKPYVSIPDLNILIAQFPHTNLYIPKPPESTSPKITFPFYKKKFVSVYFLIGQEKKGIWSQFEEAYYQIIPQQQRPLQNCVSYKQIETIKKKMRGFFNSGVQLKVLIEVKKSQLKKLHQEIKEILSQKEITKVYIEDSENTLGAVRPKYKILPSIKRQFEKQIKRSIKSFANLKDVIYFNFVNLEAKSVEVFQRKNLIQECIRPKEIAKLKSNFENFSQMLQKYQNVYRVSQIERVLYDNKKGNVNGQVEKYKAEIKKIQEEQKQFCNYFRKELEKGVPIEQRSDKGEIYFKIVDEYKQEHSIYEIINNGIRRSFQINEVNVECMSTYIKYLYEAICHFFEASKKQFKFKRVYRGGRMSDMELQTIKQGSILMNLGFMSTSLNENVATNFMADIKNGYLFIINLGQDYDKSDYQLEGFFQLQREYQKRKKVSRNSHEKEVLFNPLNVFRISKIDNQRKRIQLEYAPHITLAIKMKTQPNNITREQKQQFEAIKSHLSSLIRSNYDKGKDLHQKGETSKALQFYEQAEKNGEILTTTQKFNLLQILSQKKEYGKIQIQLQKLKRECKSRQQKNKANKIMNLNKQSQYLQINCQYFESQKIALQAEKQSQLLQKEVQKSNKKTDKQVIESFYSYADSNLKLSQSRYQKNENEKSIQNALLGFKYVDELYVLYERNLFPKIKIILQKNFENLSKNSHLFPNLMKIRHSKFPQSSLQKKQENLKKSFKQQGLSNQLKFDQKIFQLNNYFASKGKNSSGRAEIFEMFEQASYEIQNQLDTGPSLKLLKTSLLEIREGIKKIRNCQKQLYDVIKSNLKVTNKDLKPCLKVEKQCYYRSPRFEKYEEYIKKEMEEEINLEKIREYNKYSSFLMEYVDICENEEQKRKYKDISSKIVDALLEKIKIVQKEYQSQGIKLTQTKTQLTQTRITEFKNNSINSSIIDKAAAQFTVSKNDKSKFRSVAGSKNRVDFFRVKEKLSQLEKSHESDTQINQFYFILRDLNIQIDLLNNSYSIAESSHEYLQFLAQANQKIEQFNAEYMKKTDLKINEQLALFYILDAQNKLKRGYFKQAEYIINKTKKQLIEMYNKQNKGQKISFNTLVAREVPVKLFKIESELVGIYGTRQKKNEVINYLLGIKKFVQIHASLNVLAQAQINQSVAFVAMRVLPEKIPEIGWQKVYQCAQQSLNKAIQYRRGLLGDQNEYLAIAYTFLIFIKSKKSILKPNELRKVEEQHDHAKSIFSKLAAKIISQNGTQSEFSHMQKQPLLFLYKLLMEKSYQKIINQNQPGGEPMLKVFRQHVNAFQENDKGLKSLEIVESIFEAGQLLSAYPQYKEEGEKYLQKCQDDIQVINTVNRDYIQDNEKMGSNQLIQIKYKLYSTFLKIYDSSWSWSDRKKRQKYQNAVKKMDKLIKKRGQSSLDLGFFQFTFNLIQNCFG